LVFAFCVASDPLFDFPDSAVDFCVADFSPFASALPLAPSLFSLALSLLSLEPAASPRWDCSAAEAGP
jgi:hypothetical protein